MPETVRYFNPDNKKFEDYPWDEELGKPHIAPVAEAKQLSQAATILHDAAALIDGDRHDQHGDRHENFGTIAAYWTVLFGIDIEAWQVARAFELAKIARDVNGSANIDNAKDASAYSALSWELRNVGC